MRYFLSLVLASCLWLVSLWFVFPATASPLSPVVMVLPGLEGVFRGASPDNLGVDDQGQLAACPASPNCVVSQQADDTHAIAPFTYQSDRETARKALLDVLSVVPGATVVAQTEDYIRFEAQSRLLGFVDDGEFYLPADENIIHLRSAARLGESDLGVNRRRLEQIRLALKDLGV